MAFSGGAGIGPPTAAKGLGANLKAPAAGGLKGGAKIGPPKPPGPIKQTGAVQFHGGPVKAPPGAFATPGASPAGGPTSSNGSPAAPTLDATAIANMAENQFKANQAIANLQQQQTSASTALQQQLAALHQQQPLSDLRLMTGANARGGLLTSAYGQQLGNLNQTFADKQLADQSAYGDKSAQIANAITGLQQGVPIYDAQQAAAAAERASNTAAKSPASTLPTAPAKPAGGNRQRLAQAIARGVRSAPRLDVAGPIPKAQGRR